MQRLFHSRAEGQIRRSGEGFVFSPLMLFISSHVCLAMGLESGGCKMRQRTHIHTHACAQAHTCTHRNRERWKNRNSKVTDRVRTEKEEGGREMVYTVSK